MNFNKHSNLAGSHAFLSPSQHSWVNYDPDKLTRVFFTAMAAKRGTELHAFAHDAIRLGIKLPDNTKTLNRYVNDAIGFQMEPEVTLYYSENCYGHADCIGYRFPILRVFDLKTGEKEASIHQLEVYAALFCLEYDAKPFETTFDLRIYQNDDVRAYEGDPDIILHIMDRIRTFDRLLNKLRLEVES